MKLVLGPPRKDRPAFENRWDLLLGIVSDLSIFVGERRWLYGEMFPVVELAVSLQRWLDDLDEGTLRDLSYESMEWAEKPLLELVRRDGGWVVRSAIQDYEEDRILQTRDVRDAARSFVEDVIREVRTQLDLDVRHLIVRPGE